MKQPAVYMLASKQFGTLYIGVTSNLIKRIWEHKENIVPGFSKKYRIHNLVWFELHDDMYTAICREKALKKWNRSWKINLVEHNNPRWLDLYTQIL